MATRKPMKKFKRYDEGGEVATDEPKTRRITFNNDGTRTQSFGEQIASRQKMGGDESALKQKGLEISNKDAKPSGFLDSIKSTFGRLGEGSIDTPGTEAYNKYGAGRARAAAPVPVANQLTPRKVSIGDAEYEDDRAKKRAMERSRVMQQDISAGTDFVDRPQDEGYRPYISPRDRAIAEGEKDSDKIIENTGPRTKPIVKTPVKPVASKPTASKPPTPAASAPATPAKPAEAAASQIPGQSTKAPQGGEKIDSSETERNINAALTATGLGGAAAGVYKLKKMYDASKAAKKALLKNPRLARPGTVAGKDFLARDYEGAAKTASKGVPKKQLGYKKDTDVTDVTPKKTSYRSETDPIKREDGKAAEAYERLKKLTGSSSDMKRGGAVKKYASGGMVSSASKRADGIATKGKTNCKMR